MNAGVDQSLSADALRGFLQARSILAADASRSSRMGVTQALISLGADPSRIRSAGTFDAAERELACDPPGIILCDYDLSGKRGLELVRRFRAASPDPRQAIFLMVTDNATQAAVSRAAEEDVDGYVIRPFAKEVLRGTLARAVASKINPSAYLARIEAGKQLLADGKVADAIREFEVATRLHDAPSLACFYLGQAHQLLTAIAEAEERYAEGLQHNRIHHKCLVGMLQVLSSQDRHQDAYAVAQRLVRYFPADATGLSQALKLAILTQSYQDVERLYQAYTRLERPDADVVRHVCAALMVCGKHYLEEQHASRARELFAKAVAVSKGKSQIFREVVLTLIGAGEWQEAATYLQQMRQIPALRTDFLALSLVLRDRRTGDSEQVVEQAERLLAQGVRDPLIYETCIRHRRGGGQEQRLAALIAEAKRYFPEEAERFG